jgi:hypothetical protein
MPYVWRCQISYNGSGTFNINTSGQPVVTGTVISSTAFNALTADLGTGLSTAITKDGQTVATARIPFAAGINSSLVTDATSTTTGSIITAGGVGIAKALYVGTTLNVAGASTVGTTLGVGAATPSASGAGITFPATQSASTDANTLDDYEEGSWTPGQGSGLTVVGTFSSAGRYVKIGRVVTITGHVKATTSVSFLAANAIIANNLPFSSNDGGGFLPANGVGVNDAATANAVFAVSGTNMYSQGAMAATPAYYFSATYFYS